MDESVVKHLEQQNEVADVLRRAKALIGTPEKWGKDVQVAWGGRLCVNLAINQSRVWLHEEDEAGNLFRDANSIDGETPDWNDAPERTHADVMQAFDRAIALATSPRAEG